jgi:hypothetical protein
MCAQVVKYYGPELEFASAALQADKDVVRAALAQDAESLEFASEELQADGEFTEWVAQFAEFAAWAGVEEFSDFDLENATAEQQANKEVVRLAVSLDGASLEFVPAALQGDREVVRAAVSQDGSALEFASAELQNDKELLMVALLQSCEALQYASAGLKGDKEVSMVVAANPQNWQALQYISDERKDDKDVFMTAVLAGATRALVHGSEKLKADAGLTLALEVVAAGMDELLHDFTDDEADDDPSMPVAAAAASAKIVRVISHDV